MATFENLKGERFVGKIIQVTPEGKLKVQLEDALEVDFDVKEIKMLY